MLWKIEKLFVSNDDHALHGLTKMLEVLFTVKLTTEFVRILFTFLFGECAGTSLRMYVDECYYERIRESREPGVFLYITDDPRLTRSISMTRNGKLVGFDNVGAGVEVSLYEEETTTAAKPSRPLRVVGAKG